MFVLRSLRQNLGGKLGGRLVSSLRGSHAVRISLRFLWTNHRIGLIGQGWRKRFQGSFPGGLVGLPGRTETRFAFARATHLKTKRSEFLPADPAPPRFGWPGLGGLSLCIRGLSFLAPTWNQNFRDLISHLEETKLGPGPFHNVARRRSVVFGGR